MLYCPGIRALVISYNLSGRAPIALNAPGAYPPIIL
jgi:hypothetical protein